MMFSVVEAISISKEHRHSLSQIINLPSMIAPKSACCCPLFTFTPENPRLKRSVHLYLGSVAKLYTNCVQIQIQIWIQVFLDQTYLPDWSRIQGAWLLGFSFEYTSRKILNSTLLCCTLLSGMSNLSISWSSVFHGP